MSGQPANEGKLARNRSMSENSLIEDAGFHMVEDNTRMNVGKKKPPVLATSQQIVQPVLPAYTGPVMKHKLGGKKRNKAYYNRYHQTNYARTKFANSGAVRSEWTQVNEQLHVSHLEKQDTDIEFTFETLCEYGSLMEFNPLFVQKIKPKNSLKLSRNITEPTNNTTSYEDNIISSLQDHEFDDDMNYFFMTEEILTTLATCHRGAFPWNIFFLKYKNKFSIFTNKDDNTSTMAVVNTYNENINSDLPEDEGVMTRLCLESHLSCENLARQTLDTKKPIVTKNIVPVDEFGITQETADENSLPENKMYVYKKIVVDKKNVVFCRFTIDAYEKEAGVDNPLLIRAVHDTGKNDWSLKWDQNHAVIKADIQKNNICKYMQWLLVAYINDITNFKLGFVTRNNLKKDDEHRIIKVENVQVSDIMKFFMFNPQETFTALNLVMNHMKQVEEDGQYVINRAAFKNVLTIYKIPDSEANEQEGSEHSDTEAL